MKNRNKKVHITYNAKPNVPNRLCHRFPLQELTTVRTMKFEVGDIEDAWKFMLECTSPITKLKQILFAFGYQRGKQILDAIEEGLIDERGRWKDLEYKPEETLELS